MIGAVVENMIGGFLHPRASVRRLLAGEHGLDAAIAMVLLAFLVRQILLVITPGARPEELSAIPVGWYFSQLVQLLFVFALLSAVVYAVGRMFDGKGTFHQSGLVIAWYLLVTSVIDPFALVAWMQVSEAARAAEAGGAEAVNIPAGAMLGLIACLIIATWLFASYVAELHRFASTWSVLGAVVGLSFLFSLVFSALMSSA